MRTNTYYPDDPEKDQLVRQFLAKLRRETKAPVPHRNIPCQGGPYDGQKIRISVVRDPNYGESRSLRASTAVFRVGEWHGRYAGQANTNYRAAAGVDSLVLKWESVAGESA